MWKRLLLGMTVTLSMASARSADSQQPVAGSPAEVRLYAMDCGHADLKDMALFSDTGEYDGHPGSIVVPCFLILHPKGILLWDTGLGDAMAASPKGVDNGGIHMSVPQTLASQLQMLQMSPRDVTLVAFSHLHFDHTGNANLFPDSMWIVNRTELDWAHSTPTPFGVSPDTFAGHDAARITFVDGDYDVFGDGRVTILKAPGHTPGHQALRLRLKKSGTIVLSGDLYHLRGSVPARRVPTINTDRAATLASMQRVDTIVKNTHARLIVQHDPGDFAALPKFPRYLD